MTAALAGAASGGPVPIELGRVQWQRGVDKGFVAAEQSDKPLLILFQEIPGCGTCKSFGSGPLSHPLLVDAMETEFVPVVVHNNRPGEDAAMLQRFHEPAWNNPVLRFFAADGEELLARQDGIWDAAGVSERLIAALEAAGRTVPAYLRLAATEVRAAETARATFGMHCFWQGEAGLGGMDGVIATRTGHLDGREAVEVAYVADILSYDELLQGAVDCDCAARVFAHDDRQWEAAHRKVGARAVRIDAALRAAPATDQKWYLRHSHWRYVPLTPAQAARVNSDLAAGGEPSRWLSPRQVDLERRVAAVDRSAPNALAGLEPPLALQDLQGYEARLRARLDDPAAR